VSGTKVVNGVEIDATDFPAVVALRDDLGRLGCTGTFVGEHTILTAAHCTSTVLNLDGTRPGLVLRHSDYGDPDQRSDPVDVNDVAILVFTTKSTRHPMKVSTVAPQAGETLKYIGFGCLDASETPDPDGTKREGTNAFEGFVSRGNHEGMLQLPAVFSANSQPDGTGADACFGDSGGPVLRNNKIVGTVSGADFTHSYQTNLLDASNATFFRQANGAGADVVGAGRSSQSDLLETLFDGADASIED
jgi:hypothetical protein